jgi:uncharacterized caspase-like protein
LVGRAFRTPMEDQEPRAARSVPACREGAFGGPEVGRRGAAGGRAGAVGDLWRRVPAGVVRRRRPHAARQSQDRARLRRGVRWRTQPARREGRGIGGRSLCDRQERPVALRRAGRSGAGDRLLGGLPGRPAAVVAGLVRKAGRPAGAALAGGDASAADQQARRRWRRTRMRPGSSRASAGGI